MPNRRRDLSEERASERYSEDLLAEQRRRKKVSFPGVTGRPEYQSLVNVQEEQRLARQGAVDEPTVMPQLRRSAPRQMSADTRPIVTGSGQFLGPIGPGGRSMGEPIVQGGPATDTEMMTAYGGDGGIGRGRVRLTPQQQAQNWSDVNTAANAEIVPEGGQPSAAPVYNLFGRQHLDTAMISMGRDAIPQDVRNAYRAQTKDADTKLRLALSSRAGEFATLDEAKLFISSLGFDDRIGQHIDNRMVEFLSRSQPELYKQFVGEQKAESANDSSYVQWVKQNDPSMVRATSEQILAVRTPEQQFAFDQDINARHYEYDAVTGQPALRPERKLTPVEEAQQLEKTVDATIRQSGGQLQKTWKGGKPQAISIEEVQEAKQLKAEQYQDKRVTQLTTLAAQLEKRKDANIKKADETPELLSMGDALKRNAAITMQQRAAEDELMRLIETPEVQPALAAAPVVAPAAPQVGEVRKGYRYQGGDPAQPGSWVPVGAAPVPTPVAKEAGTITAGGRTVAPATGLPGVTMPPQPMTPEEEAAAIARIQGR